MKPRQFKRIKLGDTIHVYEDKIYDVYVLVLEGPFMVRSGGTYFIGKVLHDSLGFYSLDNPFLLRSEWHKQMERT